MISRYTIKLVVSRISRISAAILPQIPSFVRCRSHLLHQLEFFNVRQCPASLDLRLLWAAKSEACEAVAIIVLICANVSLAQPLILRCMWLKMKMHLFCQPAHSVVINGLPDFFFCVHHERAILFNWFTQRTSSQK